MRKGGTVWLTGSISMRLRDAVDMLAGSDVAAPGPATWADLGCGDGTFTVALASVLAPGSIIHAMDRDRSVLRQIPAVHNGVRITTYAGDFAGPWPFAGVDGILMANSLHYVEDQAAFIRSCERRMNARRRFLIVEYDTDSANAWVPYPLSRTALQAWFARLDCPSIAFLRSRPSVYRRAPLYSALITCAERPS
jgi:ubiquinone/menaquinone biosynthesis C-methylase UbiE